MIARILAWVAVFFVPAAAFGQSPVPAAVYRVAWRTSDFPKAHVDARIASKDCTFGTSRKWASFFEDDSGWSRFVTGLSARDRRGRMLHVQPLPAGRWQVGSRARCEVFLSYTVDFSFGRQVWSAGNEQVGYTTDQAIFSTGLPLFIVGDSQPATVEIIKPAGWAFATPWAPATLNRYQAANQEALLENAFVVGQLYTESFNAGKFHVTAALLGHPDSSADLFRATFSKVAPALVRTFADDREGRYMFVVLNGAEDGESFADSFAVSTEHAPTAENRIIWANHLAHELIHYWLGKSVTPVDSDAGRFKWLTEGLTEYLANRTLRDTGVYSPSDFMDRMSRHFGNYLLTRQNPLFMETSLQAAGAKGWANRPLIYSGGAALGFCLDARIRRSSAGARSLDDVLRGLQSRATRGEKLTDDVFVEELSKAAAADMQDFYKRYVVGTATLPIGTCAREAGYEMLDQGYDVFLRPATGAAR